MTNDKVKIVFAKATAKHFMAIVLYKEESVLRVCDVITSSTISDFITDVIALAHKHGSELVNYECSVFKAECYDLRTGLLGYDIKVRGYESEGKYAERIISQADFIRSYVSANAKHSDFIEKITSFNIDVAEDNIAIDVLADAVVFFRRYYFY